MAAIANEGRLLAIGFASGEWHTPSTVQLVNKNASLVGVYVGAYSKPQMTAVHESLLSLWREKRLASLVSQELPFDEADQALGALARRSAVGKIVIRG